MGSLGQRAAQGTLQCHSGPADITLCIACWVTPETESKTHSIAWRDHLRWREEVTTPHIGPRLSQAITASELHQWPPWRPPPTCPPTSPPTRPLPPPCTPASMTHLASGRRQRPLPTTTGPWGWGRRVTPAT